MAAVIKLKDWLLELTKVPPGTPTVDKLTLPKGTPAPVADTITLKDFKANPKYIEALKKAGYALKLEANSAARLDYQAARDAQNASVLNPGQIPAKYFITDTVVPTAVGGKIYLTVGDWKAYTSTPANFFSTHYGKALVAAGNTVGVLIQTPPTLQAYKDAAAVIKAANLDPKLIVIADKTPAGLTPVKTPITLTASDFVSNPDFVSLVTAVRLKREQIQLVVDGDVVGTGVAARKGLLQGHLLEKSD